MTLRYKDIGEIINLIDSSSCDEFVLETDEVKLVLRRRGAGAAPAVGGVGARPVPVTSSQPAAPAPTKASASEATAATRAKSTQTDAPGVVSAPMVGTFYRAPSPDEPPFVEVGSKVGLGDPLCIIEVMKLFTTVHAEFAGTVREVGAENAQLVEYGQMLFVIEPG